MKQVRKFQFPNGKNLISIETSGDAKVVHIGEQMGIVTLWIESSDRFPQLELRKTVHFAYFPTGCVIPQESEHVGTVQMESRVVWHIYEVK